MIDKEKDILGKKKCQSCGLYLNPKEIDSSIGVCLDCQIIDMQLQAIADTQ